MYKRYIKVNMSKPITTIYRFMALCTLIGLSMSACSPEVNVQEPVSVNQSARIEAAANLRLYAGLIAE
ncbi:hypothetical protein, partial [Spirosoma luteolum]